MTKYNLDDFFKQYEPENVLNEERQRKQAEAEMTPPPVPNESKSIFQSGLQTVEKAGGALLANTVKGIASIGQGIMGAFEYLETNTQAYDMLYGNDDSSNAKAGTFQWDKLDDFVGGAIKAGVSQGERVLQSKNLTEFGQNVYTGVDLLKNLPGPAGDFYKNQDSQSAKIATSIAGFGLEVLLDPTAKVAGAASGLAGRATQGAVATGKMSERTADVIGRGAANLATGNWVGGGIAMTARESAFAAKEKLVVFANKNYNTRRGKAAETILEWAMGPNALTTNAEMRTVAMKYAALREDLPKEMIRIANKTATVVSHLPTKQRTQAQKVFGELASAQTAEAEEAALDSLSKMGISRQQAASLGADYRSANLRLMDIIQTASKDVPGLENISANMSEYHVRRTYRMFVDPKVRQDWLDHLIKQNTPGSWQLKQTSLRNQLMDGLGISEQAVPKIDIRFEPDVKNQGDVVGGFDTFRPKTSFNKNPNAERQATLQLEIMKTDDLIRNAAPGEDVSSHLKVKERLTQQVEALDKMTAGTGPNSFAAPKIKRLQSQIDLLDNAINASTEKNVDKLVERRNILQAQLENTINAVPNNTGLPNKQQSLFDDVIPGERIPKAVTIEDAFPSMRQELAETRDVMYLPTPAKITKDVRLEYIDELQKFIEDNESIRQSALVGFRKGENGQILANFEQRYSTAKDKTLLDIQRWTADWATAKGIPEEEIGKLNAAVSNSLTYVPGSREFVSMVREKGQAITDLDPQLQQIIQNEIGLNKIDLSAVQNRTLDPVFHELFGVVDEFSVNAADQGLKVGEIAAKGMMLSELRKRGLVLTEKEVLDNPELNNLGGWVREDKLFQMGDETTPYYIQTTNLRAIKAIDRSLGDLDKFQFLSIASNMFRRAALTTDPSAHATQFLGNIAMLKMMGFRNLFGKDVDVVKGFNQSFRSVMLNDEGFKDAVDAGVMVTQTILTDQQAAAVNRAVLTIPRASEANGDRLGALTHIFRATQEIYGNTTRRTLKSAGDALANVPGLDKGTDSIDAANLALSPSAMFQVSDQMTRLFAYRSTMKNKTNELVKANPFLANFTVDGGSRINWEAAEKHAATLFERASKNPYAAPEQIPFSPENISGLKETYTKMREEAAQVANDVALNYSDVPLAINYASKTGVIPFIKFQYKATGRIMQFMDEKPWAFSPYYAAQNNLNEGLNPDPDNFEQQRMALSPTVRDAMVIPTGARDSMGRQEFLDLSRWIPFGMYAGAANGGTSEGGLAMQPSSIVSTPMLDLLHTFYNAEEEKAPGQSMASFVAQKLAETFSPAGVGPGSRKIEALANAIQQSTVYVDADGNVVERTPSTLEKSIVNYAALPENVGQIGTELGNAIANKETLTTAMGNPKPQTALRPRTTVEQAKLRYAIPGVGFSADMDKTATEYSKRYDIRRQELTNMKNAIGKQAGANLTAEHIKQIDRIDAQIRMLDMQQAQTNNALILGE